jgi:hypothetical protein
LAKPVSKMGLKGPRLTTKKGPVAQGEGDGGGSGTQQRTKDLIYSGSFVKWLRIYWSICIVITPKKKTAKNAALMMGPRKRSNSEDIVGLSGE